MRHLLLLNKDTGSPLRCLGTNAALQKTNELEVKAKDGLLTILLPETSVLVYGVWRSGGTVPQSTGVAEDELYSFSHRPSAPSL